MCDLINNHTNGSENWTVMQFYVGKEEIIIEWKKAEKWLRLFTLSLFELYFWSSFLRLSSFQSVFFFGGGGDCRGHFGWKLLLKLTSGFCWQLEGHQRKCLWHCGSKGDRKRTYKKDGTIACSWANRHLSKCTLSCVSDLKHNSILKINFPDAKNRMITWKI